MSKFHVLNLGAGVGCSQPRQREVLEENKREAAEAWKKKRAEEDKDYH